MTERNESADQAQDAIRRLKQKLTLAEERIRELEAELMGGTLGKPWSDLLARAEKAEARVAELEAKMAMFVNTPNNWLLEKDRMLTRIHELSGRVRELEAELETFRTAPLSAYAALYARAEKAELEIASCPNKYWHQSVKLRGLVI